MNELTYRQWMIEIDKILLNKLGVSTSDLADFCSRDLYDDGVSPEEAVLDVLENDDMDGLDIYLEMGN